MARFCNNCGIENENEKTNFCTNCGAMLPSPNITSDDNNKKSKKSKKTPFLNLAFYISVVFIVFVLLIFIASIFGTYSDKSNIQTISSSESNRVLTVSSTYPTETDAQKNVRICTEIVQQYHSTHSYYSNDIFDCDNMASDVWDMVKSKGINAKIKVGRVDYKIDKITEANHAWVLAEVAPDSWIALEATSGQIIKKENPLYFWGWSFNNPKQLRDYETLLKQYNDAVNKHNQARTEYNSLVDQYNSAGYFTQISLSSSVNTKLEILNQRTQDINEINKRIGYLLEANS